VNRAWVPHDHIIDINDTAKEDSVASNSEANKANTIY
jgi:hypothetical protein